jgi:hypothetical protein
LYSLFPFTFWIGFSVLKMTPILPSSSTSKGNLHAHTHLIIEVFLHLQMIYAKIRKKLGALSPYFQPPESGPFLMWFLPNMKPAVSMDQAYFICNPRAKQLRGFPCRKPGQETRKGNMNVHSSHSGTFM